MTEQAKAPEVVLLAEGILAFSIFFVDREELRCYDLSAVL
jgi:hypothetical protein